MNEKVGEQVRYRAGSVRVPAEDSFKQETDEIGNAEADHDRDEVLEGGVFRHREGKRRRAVLLDHLGRSRKMVDCCYADEEVRPPRPRLQECVHRVEVERMQSPRESADHEER